MSLLLTLAPAVQASALGAADINSSLPAVSYGGTGCCSSSGDLIVINLQSPLPGHVLARRLPVSPEAGTSAGRGPWQPLAQHSRGGAWGSGCGGRPSAHQSGPRALSARGRPLGRSSRDALRSAWGHRLCGWAPSGRPGVLRVLAAWREGRAALRASVSPFFPLRPLPRTVPLTWRGPQPEALCRPGGPPPGGASPPPPWSPLSHRPPVSSGAPGSPSESDEVHGSLGVHHESIRVVPSPLPAPRIAVESRDVHVFTLLSVARAGECRQGRSRCSVTLPGAVEDRMSAVSTPQCCCVWLGFQTSH